MLFQTTWKVPMANTSLTMLKVLRMISRIKEARALSQHFGLPMENQNVKNKMVFIKSV